MVAGAGWGAGGAVPSPSIRAVCHPWKPGDALILKAQVSGGQAGLGSLTSAT